MMKSLGQDLSDSDLATLYVQMDPSGDGEIEVDELEAAEPSLEVADTA